MASRGGLRQEMTPRVYEWQGTEQRWFVRFLVVINDENGRPVVLQCRYDGRMFVANDDESIDGIESEKFFWKQI